ncbi:uncharacterized protein LOC112552941 isoform X1 [Pogonomyrmex barbatus]|uniref:Uncharacterized protein LOC112552941 isoform X1 n=1 Tax=Pogonomyrmex barbatus TaxID=144034 RepID=A0A8N1SBB1_9HYME|nr:uncharacterized protein LOC112552941 isoform X1 [Pogonomyrmex barbatus]
MRTLFSHSPAARHDRHRSGRSNTRAITCRYWSLIGAPGSSVDMPIIGLLQSQPAPARTHYWQSSMTMHLKFEKGSWKHRGCYTLDYPSSLTRVDSSRIWNTRTLVISHARGKYSSFSHPVYR